MNAEPLKLKIMDVPGGRVIAQAKRKGSFEVWRAFMNHDELMEWLRNEIGCLGGDGLHGHRAGADAPDAGAVGCLPSRPEPDDTEEQLGAHLRGQFAERIKDAAPRDDDIDRWVEAEPEPVATLPNAEPVRNGRRPNRSREEKIAALVDFVRLSLAGGNGPVRLTLKEFRTTLDMVDQAVLDTVKLAIESGLLVKESRTTAAGRRESWYSLPVSASATAKEKVSTAGGVSPRPGEPVAGVQQKGQSHEAVIEATPAAAPAAAGALDARMTPAELDAASERVRNVVAARDAKEAARHQSDDLVPGQPQVLAALRSIAETNHAPSFEMQLNRLAIKSGVAVGLLPNILTALSKRGLIEWTKPKQMGGYHKFWVKGAKA